MNSVTSHMRAGTLVNSLWVLLLLAFAAVLPASAQDVGFSSATATVTEGNSVTMAVKIYDSGITNASTVNYVVQALGTCVANATAKSATPGDDFVVASGTLTFGAGSAVGASQNILVATVEDTIRENPTAAKTASECFEVQLTGFGGDFAALETNFDDAEVTITDDEADVSLSIADATAAEDSGSAQMTVSLSGVIDEDIDLDAVATYIDITTEGSTTDYNSGTDVGAILAGATSGILYVPLTDDAVYEGTEEVNVQIGAGAQYSITDGIGKLTITDDEGVPELSINDATAVEGFPVAFTITKSHGAEAAYNIALSYSDITATSGSDYTPVLSVAVAAGDATTETVNVVASNDTEVEDTENFIVSIVDGADYDLDGGNANGLGTITDNDGIDISVAMSFDDTDLIIGGDQTTRVTLVVTNNGAADAASDVILDFSDTGLDFAAATAVSQANGNGDGVTDSGDRCDSDATLRSDNQCAVDLLDMLAGETVTIRFDLNSDGAAGTTASLSATASGNTDTDSSNNADSATASVIGQDFGDGSGTFAAVAHLITGDLYLGDVAPDAETAQGATFTGDDTTGDDEDGLQLLGPILQDATGHIVNYLGVKVSAAGFLSIVARYDQTYESLQNYPVVAGVNWVPLTVYDTDATAPIAQAGGAAAGTPGALTALRLRVCSTSGACDEEADLLTTGGEVEDYDVSSSVATQAATTTATLSVPVGTVEPVVISSDGTDITVADGNGATMYSQTNATLSAGITITGNAGANTLAVDVDNLAANFQINYDGGDGADALELTDSGATTFTDVDHTFTNATDGTIAGDALWDVTYSNLAPILDNLSAVNRDMTFGATADTIVLRDNGSSVDGMSFIDSNNSEQVTFTNPTTSLTINAGDGADTIDFQGVDETAPNNSFTITFNGDNGADTFTILPIPNTSSLGALTVAGGGPATCSGDVLDINTSGGAVIDNLTPTPVTFTAGSHNSIAFSGIEAFADQSADVALSATSTAGTDLNAGDITTITLTVTNNGPDTASCVVVADILLDGAFTISSGPTFSVGSFNSPQWNVGALASGDSATLTYTVTVGQTFNGTASITASSPEGDADATNNSVSFGIEPAFPFPTKAQATAAEWFGSGANEHLVVGLANGFAGLNSSVLCRVPPSAGFPENLYRECGDGLPYPLYVNDLFLDDQGTPADSTDDKLYLASWGSAGLYVSEDGGENFTAAEPALGPKGGWTNVYAIVEDASGFLYISANNGHVFRSLNNGTTWQQIGSLPGVASDTPWSLSAHGTQAGRLYAGTFGNGVFTSDDFGFNWTKVGGDAVNALLIADDGGHAFDLELHPTGSHLFAATAGGVFRMALNANGTAAGLWDMVDTDVTLDSGTVTPEARSMAFDSNDDLYVTTWGHGAFRATSPTTATAMTQIALRGANVAFVAVNPAGDQVVFGTDAEGLVFMAAGVSSTDVEDETLESEIPSGYVLNQNYPNPFNPVTTISFALPQTGQARLAVYDVLGREVQVLMQGTVQAGQHEVQFDAAGLPTGTYIYRLETDKGSFSKQLVLMK